MGWWLLFLGSVTLVGCDSNEPMAPQVGDITILSYGQYLDRLWAGEFKP